MKHLLYSSNEMYSSTDLIRKSKMIFNKIINEEINKAIILRDGKPSFILLDFEKYEKIMGQYDMFKKEITKPNINEESKNIKSTKEVVKKTIMKEKNTKKANPSKVTPPTPDFEEEDVVAEEIEQKPKKTELKEFWA